MAELHEELQTIKEQLSLVTKILPKVTELKEAFWCLQIYKGGNRDTGPGLIRYSSKTASQEAAQQPDEAQHFCPITQLPVPGPDGTCPQVLTSGPQVRQPNSSADTPVSGSNLPCMQQLKGVIKVAQIEINDL